MFWMEKQLPMPHFPEFKAMLYFTKEKKVKEEERMCYTLYYLDVIFSMIVSHSFIFFVEDRINVGLRYYCVKPSYFNTVK